MNDLISVVIPVYNVEKYLKQCIDSVLNQTYKNIEIILVDDKSPDKCGEICDDYSSRYSNIKTIHKENNEGLGLARNTGIENATGQYIYFLDSDDYIKDNEIQIVYDAIIKYSVDVVISGFTSFDDTGKVLKIRKYDNEVFQGNAARTEMLPRLIGSSPVKKDSFEMSAAGTMYAMSVIREHKIRFVSERKLKNEDMVFNIDFFQHANGACAIDSVGMFYRYNKDSLSHIYKEDRFERDKIFYHAMIDKLTGLGYGEDVINRLQRHFFIHIFIAIKQINDVRGNKSFKERNLLTKNLCNDNLIQDVIKSYPIKLLGFKQKLFLFLIKNKYSEILNIIINFSFK